jgi:hypothetical protein
MAERAFCKAYLDLKAEAAKANELDALEKQIGKLKGEARRYEELGGGREADSQSAVLPRKRRSRCSPHEIMSVSGHVTLKESRTLHEGREPGAAAVSQSSTQVHDLSAKKTGMAGRMK